jgi:hypothetical protein
MIKVANNLLNVWKFTLIAKSASAAPVTSHPFNIHDAGSPNFYYSYGNSPATSLDPGLVDYEGIDIDGRPATPQEFAGAMNTMLSMERGRGEDVLKYTMPPRGPRTQESYTTNYSRGWLGRLMGDAPSRRYSYLPSMSEKYDNYLRMQQQR